MNIIDENEINEILPYLDDYDKITFKEKVIKMNDFDSFIKMNIWYQNNIYSQTIKEYKYTEIKDSIYAFPLPNSTIIMFTKTKKIIFQANQTNYNLSHVLKNLKNILFFRDNLKTDNITKVEQNVIFTQNFNYLYGHFCDEIFISYDFFNENENKNNVCLVNYNPNLKNCNEISSLLFDTKIINIRGFNDGIELQNICIIEHHYNLHTYHSFPLSSKFKILSSIQINYQYKHKNLFLTRRQQYHINRDIDNLYIIENELQKNGFIILNPENNTYSETIQIIQNAENIVITWGSALVNLIYSKPGAQIIILKSKSYENENIGIFRNLIKKYNLNIKIIKSNDNNNIEPNQVIESLSL